MQFSTKVVTIERLRASCAVVPVVHGHPFTDAAARLDAALEGRLSAMLGRGDLEDKAGSSLMLHLDGNLPRVLLVSVGKDTEVSEKAFSEACAATWRELARSAADEVVSLLHHVPVSGRTLEWRLAAQVSTGRTAAYRFEQMKSKRSSKPPRPQQVVFAIERAQATAANAAVARAVALANGQDLTRTLGNLPPNICTPTYLANEARKLGRELSLKVEVLERKQIEALKMGAFLAVGRLGGDDLDQALEAAESGRRLLPEIDQHLMMGRLEGLGGQQERSVSGQRVARRDMGDEVLIGEGPQQLVEAGELDRILAPDHRAPAAAVDLAQQPATVVQLVRRVEVEIDPGHPSARAIRKRVSSGTGRPLAPFWAPDFQAVPAMSRCAQSYFLVKRARKQAAVTAPASRPPTLATSANRDFNEAW